MKPAPPIRPNPRLDNYLETDGGPLVVAGGLLITLAMALAGIALLWR